MPPVEVGVRVQAHAGAEPPSKGPRFPCKNFVLKCNAHAETCGVKEQLGKFPQTEPPRSQHPGAPLVFASSHYPALSALTPTSNSLDQRFSSRGPAVSPWGHFDKVWPCHPEGRGQDAANTLQRTGWPLCRGPQVSSEAEEPRQGRLRQKPSPSSLAQSLQSHLTRSAPPVFSSLGTT